MGLIGFELVYVVAANVILKTHTLDDALTGSTPGLLLKIGSGWTVFPGRVHVEDVELHFQDYNVQFAVMLDEGTVDIALWQLPGKVFHLTRVRAQGVRYHFRHKVKSAAGIEDRLALYPKIAGFADPPLFQGPPTPPLTDEQYDLWTIHLEDVVADAKELWFLEYRFTGRARAKGAFRIVPEREAMTEHCTLALDGVLRVGEQDVASKLQGWLHAQLDHHDPRRVQGAQVFKYISVNTKLDAELPDLAFTELYRSQGGVELSRGTGRVQARVQIENGAWMENTAVRYETDGITIAQKPVVVAGPLLIEAAIAKRGPAGPMELTATTPRLSFAVHGAAKGIDGPHARAVHLGLGLSVDLTKSMEPQSLRAKTKVEIPELRWLNHALQSEGLFTHGSSRADVDLRWSTGKPGGGTVAFEAEQARFKMGDNTLQVSGTADARVTYDGAADRGMFDALELKLPQVAVLHEGDWKSLPGGLRARSERFRWQGEPPQRMQGRFALDAESIEPFLPYVISSSVLRSIAKLIVSLGETHAIVELDRTPEALELTLEEARSAKLRVFGILRSEKGIPEPCGRFFLQNPTLNFAIEMHGGKTSVRPFASPNWWRERPPTTSCGPDFKPRERSDANVETADDRAKALARR